ncbi:MAG: adenylosuccinate lyase [Flavobacteriaceae bacterium]
MNLTELDTALKYVDHTRQKRMQMAMKVSEDPNLIEHLITIAFTDKDEIASRACWIIEFTAKKELPYLFPYIDEFTAHLNKIRLDSSVRPLAKICELLMKAYFVKKEPDVMQVLTETHLERITAACFDWLIGDHKVAAKAYSMTSLLLLGRKYKWILPELKLVLEQNYAQGSAAYKARARLTLAKINKLGIRS